jgi:farnesyl diphosphate synthase
MAQKTTLKEFESVFPTLVEDMLAHAKQYGAPQMALDWYKAVRIYFNPSFKNLLTFIS